MNGKIVPIIDFHAHILPFVDHGSQSTEMSAELLSQAMQAGVTAIIATPHFYPHQTTVEEFLERRERGYEALVNHIKSTTLEKIKLYKGAEVALEPKTKELENLDKLVIEGTNAILIEMPMFVRWQKWMYDAVCDIQYKRELDVVLAHIDRYEESDVRDMMDIAGCYAQINTSMLMTPGGRKKARQLCYNELLHFLGSDVHDNVERSYKPLIKIRKKLNADLLEFFYSNTSSLLNH